MVTESDEALVVYEVVNKGVCMREGAGEGGREREGKREGGRKERERERERKERERERKREREREREGEREGRRKREREREGKRDKGIGSRTTGRTVNTLKLHRTSVPTKSTPSQSILHLQCIYCDM